jgi:cellulose synthase/poly-beta-1,6-N-acetylglucosamine synthase-like glycosyltransferase
MMVRGFESAASNLIGLSGSFFAVRRELCRPWPKDLASDFRSALETSRRGLRAVCARRATARIRATAEPGAEWRRKVRTVRRGLAVLSAYRSLLRPRYGRIAFTLWGHKVARFTVPLALGLLLFSSTLLTVRGSAAASVLLGSQLLAYGVAGAALRFSSLNRVPLIRLASYFLLVNASIAWAWGHHLAGRRSVTWQPTRR